jgi:hypothetical protein
LNTLWHPAFPSYNPRKKDISREKMWEREVAKQLGLFVLSASADLANLLLAVHSEFGQEVLYII